MREIEVVKIVGSFSALFAAVLVFLTGNGLLNTLLSTRLAMEGYPMAVTGIVLSCYFAGLLAGSTVCYRPIQRIGHIRAFTIFAAGTTATTLLHGLWMTPVAWGVLRFLCGISTFGMYMVIESWLNECTESRYRGRIFSIYIALSYLGIGIGQQLLNVGEVGSNDLFIVAGVIFALCLVPVSATEGIHPRLPEKKKVSFSRVFRTTPIGMLGSMSAGLTNSAFFAMMPAVCTSIGMSHSQLAWIMSAAVFSGLTAQWIVGAVSDRFDRTLVLVVLAAAIAVVSGWMFVCQETTYRFLVVKMGLLGALVFAVYPVSVARAHDVFEGKDTVAVSGSLLFAYSVGACASPLLASGLMTLLKSPLGLFAFWFLVNASLALVSFYLLKREKVEVVAVEDQVAFVPMKRSSPVVMAMDPRSEPPGGIQSIPKTDANFPGPAAGAGQSR